MTIAFVCIGLTLGSSANAVEPVVWAAVLEFLSLARVDLVDFLAVVVLEAFFEAGGCLMMFVNRQIQVDRGILNSMLQLSAGLLNKSVLSLRTGTVIATITGPIINPDNLKIEGFYCDDRYDKKRLVLLYQDIRDMLPKGYVVNDHDVLAEPDELVRLQKVMSINFELIGKQVVTVDKQKVGKVSDYATETGTMFVQKIYVAQSIFKSLTGGSLSIDRTQINEITPRRIIINELASKASAAAPATA